MGYLWWIIGAMIIAFIVLRRMANSFHDHMHSLLERHPETDDETFARLLFYHYRLLQRDKDMAPYEFTVRKEVNLEGIEEWMSVRKNGQVLFRFVRTIRRGMACATIMVYQPDCAVADEQKTAMRRSICNYFRDLYGLEAVP